MPSAKHRKGYIFDSSLFDVTSSHDVFFHQLQYIHTIHVSWCYLVFQFFLLTMQVLIYNGIVWLPTSTFSCAFHNDLDSLSYTVIHFVMLYSKQSIAINEVQLQPHFQCVIDYLGARYGFLPALFHSNWIHVERFLACLQHCNEQRIATNTA